MSQLLAREAHGPHADEAPLRIAAATLSDAPRGVITATTVVGTLGNNSPESLQALVADIAEEYGLTSQLAVHVGSFSVRFGRKEH